MNKMKCISGLFLLALFSMGCSRSVKTNEEPTPPEKPVEVARIPIRFTIGVEAPNASRVSNNAFEVNDRAGVYVVNAQDGSPGVLTASGNQVDNMRATYNSGWQTDAPIYWKDNKTAADFYVYYPYMASISNVNAVSFALRTNQSTEADYKANDFLWGKTAGQTPTENAVSIQTRHLMSKIIIKLVPGDGFTAESLAAAGPVVRINDVQTQATIDLANGQVSPSGSATTVQPYNTNNSWVAFLVPQTAGSTQLISVTVEDKTYNLNQVHTFVSGRADTFTVTVKKTSSGINVGIDGWTSEDVDYGGVAE